MAALVLVVTASAVRAGKIRIDFVPVGNVGNADDDTNYGAVGYDSSIGKYEVTVGQYTAFLNAVAKADPHGLYNTSMSGTPFGCGISRTGSDGSDVYSVDAAFVKRPVNYVSFWDAARFVNWLHNGQGNGDTESGAHVNIGNQATFARTADARCWIPTVDEWYKAAYHKNDGVTGNYWDYPTSSDSTPGRDLADVSGNNAYYYDGAGPYPIDPLYFTTGVGQFQNLASPYGTFNQGGNLWEWNEATVLNAYRGLRGGCRIDESNILLASDLGSYGSPTYENNKIGFRVASVPEPGSITL